MQISPSVQNMQHYQSVHQLQNAQSMQRGPGMQNGYHDSAMPSGSYQVIALPANVPPPEGAIPAGLAPPQVQQYGMPSGQSPSSQQVEAQWTPAPSNSGFRIVDPTTGEQVQVDLSKNSKRFTIKNPSTGKEVLPEDKEERESEVQEEAICSELQSNFLEECSEQRLPTEDDSGRVSDMESTVEAPHASSWEWPLSRQEKKERLLLLSQRQGMYSA